MRILDAVENDEQFGIVKYGCKLHVSMRGAECDYALMRNAFRSSIESFARFETNGNRSCPAELDDFLDAGTRCAFRDQDLIERALRPQGFAHRVDAGQNLVIS